jgi:predicted GH43/DUF377 family glycosyl hydrolase
MLFALFALCLAQAPAMLGDVLPEPGTMMVSDRRIDIPSLPQGSVAYNPSVVRHRGRIYLVFRLDRYDLGWATQMQLGLAELDEGFRVVRGPTLLDTRDVPWANHTSEDPRLLSHEGQLYVIFNATHDGNMSSRRAMRIAHLHVPDGEDPAADDFAVESISELIPDRPGYRPWQEKNWTPFSFDQEIHLVYRTNPPHVYKIPAAQLAQSPQPQEIRVTEVSRVLQPSRYDYGEMRGGSGAAIDGDLGEYVSFFHARDQNNYGGGNKLHYFIGLYTFAPEPPFEIRHLLPYPIVVPRMSNPGRPYIEVAYPGGFVADEAHIYLVYGKNDRSVRLLTLDRRKLLDALVPVTPNAGDD